MKADDNVHAILQHSVIGDNLQPLLLVTTVELGTRNLNPSSISGRDAKNVDTNTGELVDSGGVQEGLVACLENGTALGAKGLTESPLIRCTVAANSGPPDRVVLDKTCQPKSQTYGDGSRTVFSFSSHPPRLAPFALNVLQSMYLPPLTALGQLMS